MISKKTNKLILIVLLFLIISVLLGIKNIALGFTITSIDGKTYTIGDNSNCLDYGIGKLYNEIMSEKVEKQIINQKLDESNDFLKINFEIGDSSTSETSFNFNRNGTFYDLGTYLGGCQMVCAEPKHKVGNSNDCSKVQKVLFISEDSIKLYYSDSTQTKDIDDEYLKKLLKEGFEVKNNSNKDKYKIAQHFAKHLRSSAFNEKINGYVSNWQYENYGASGEPSENEGFTYLPDSGYTYYGIFVWVGTGAAPANGQPSQGRIIYNVVRKQKPKSIELTVKKENFAGNNLSGAKIVITGEGMTSNNIKKIQGTIWDTANYYWFMVSGNDGEFGNLLIEPKNYNNGYVIIGIKEEKAPSNYYKLPNEIIWLGIKYDTDTGKVTGVTVGNDDYEKYFEFDGTKLIMKNLKKPEYFLEKIDSVTGTRIGGIEFEISGVTIWSNVRYLYKSE